MHNYFQPTSLDLQKLKEAYEIAWCLCSQSEILGSLAQLAVCVAHPKF
jgi:hypothetical protein